MLPIASTAVTGADAGSVATHCPHEGPGGSAQGAWRHGRASRFVASGGGRERHHGGGTGWARQAVVCRPGAVQQRALPRRHPGTARVVVRRG